VAAVAVGVEVVAEGVGVGLGEGVAVEGSAVTMLLDVAVDGAPPAVVGPQPVRASVATTARPTIDANGVRSMATPSPGIAHSK
jgi:hypothetical protein